VFLGEDEPGGAPEEHERPAPPRLSAVGGKTGKGSAAQPSVLVVEDDPSMRMLCKFNLEADGFRVTTAITGHEALERAAAEEFDLVLLDVMLPDLGGFDVAKQLEGVPVVFVSARTSDADLEHGRAVGAIDYVTKPFDPVSLPVRLREDLEEFGRGGAARVWALRFGTGSCRLRTTGNPRGAHSARFGWRSRCSS
jgi:DNA-binding response OmpR family regulator